jgi:hypothetical protein
LLTIQEAVLKGRTTLAPKRLQGLSFVKNSNQFSFIDNNSIKIGDNNTGKTSDVISLMQLNAQLKSERKDTLATFNTITWKNSNQFYFSNKKGELLYTIDKKTISEIINISTNETLSRTTLTVLTTLVANLALIIYGGEAIRSFSMLVFFGIIAGTYSSIFISAPILTILKLEKFK